MGIGDGIICSGEARRAQEHDKRKVRIVDRAGRPCWDQLWDGNPRMRKPTHGSANTQTIQCGSGARRYIDYQRSNPRRWAWKQYDCPAGELYGVVPDPRAAGRILFDPTIKARASPNKQWPNWAALIEKYPDAPWTQMCQPGTAALPGAARIETPTFRDACNLIAGAREFGGHLVCHEGAHHHAAAALGVRAVVIFGEFISPAQTGYPTHENIFTGQEPCGWRVPCASCRKAMAAITPEMVMQLLEKNMGKMQQVGGVWLPADEKHLVEWMRMKKQQLPDGRLSYQLDKQKAFIAACTKHRRVLDVGAHCGLWSMNLQLAFENVDSFEPVAAHRACFEKNVSMRNVTLWPIALGEKDGMVSMHTAPTSSGDTTVAGDGDIPMRRLDDCIPHDDVDGIKIDVEGFETFVLRGAEKILERCKPTIIVESKPRKAPQFGLPESAPVDFLRARGYRLIKEISGDFILSAR